MRWNQIWDWHHIWFICHTSTQKVKWSALHCGTLDSLLHILANVVVHCYSTHTFCIHCTVYVTLSSREVCHSKHTPCAHAAFSSSMNANSMPSTCLASAARTGSEMKAGYKPWHPADWATMCRPPTFNACQKCPASSPLPFSLYPLCSDDRCRPTMPLCQNQLSHYSRWQLPQSSSFSAPSHALTVCVSQWFVV